MTIVRSLFILSLSACTSSAPVDTAGDDTATGDDTGDDTGGDVVSEPEAVATGLQNPHLLALTDDAVYIAGDVPAGKIVRFDRAAGTTSDVATDVVSPTALATDGTLVYWAAAGGEVSSASVDGGAPTVLWSPVDDSEAYVDSLATDGSNLFILTGNDLGGQSKIYRVPVGGGAPVPAHEDPAFSQSWSDLTIHGSNLFFSSTSTCCERVGRLSTGGGWWDDTDIDSFVYDVASDGTDVFLITRWEVQAFAVGTTAVRVVAAEQDSLDAVAAADGYVAWLDDGVGAVWMANADGSWQDTVADSQAGPVDIAMDDGDVFWVNHGNGTLMRRPLLGFVPTE